MYIKIRNTQTISVGALRRLHVRVSDQFASIIQASLILAMAVVHAHCSDIDISQWETRDVGNPPAEAAVNQNEGVITVSASGNGVGLNSDQFGYVATQREGDFDIQVRVAALLNTHLWAKAGLMIRGALNGNARFAGVFATPSGAGCLFQAREADGGNAANQGYFPANQPFTYLRLRREGNSISGYAGYDGKRWTLLGEKTVLFETNAWLGLAVTSHSAKTAVAQFAELKEAAQPEIKAVRVEREPLGPSSRRSAIVISEIQYHPAERQDGKNLEFVEIYNSQPFFEDISGWKLSGQIEYTFPAGTVIEGGAFIVVAAVPQDMENVYGLSGVLGPCSGKLANNGGVLRLLGENGAVYFEVDYDDRSPWPLLADGSGHSLVLTRPSYGEGNPKAWSASRTKEGSPGMVEAFEITSYMGVKINECLLPGSSNDGFVELFNGASVEADLSGFRMGSVLGNLSYKLPEGTRLQPGGYVVFPAKSVGLYVNSNGGKVYLESADQSRIVDAISVGLQTGGQSFGRWPNGGENLRSLSKPTPAMANARPQTDIVINEIHYSPISGNSDEEFIELFNSSNNSIDLSGWQLSGGIDYIFPTGAGLPAGGYLVVAHSAAKLKELYPQLEAKQLVGDFQGKLGGRGDCIVLSKPVLVLDEISGDPEVDFEEATRAAYGEGGRWHLWSDGGGSSMELADGRSDPTIDANWIDSDETSKSEWTTVEYTGTVDNGIATSGGGRPGGGGWPGGGGSTAIDSLQILLMGEGECLIDNVEVIGPGNTNRIANSTFEQGISGWTFAGNHIRSSLDTAGGFESANSLHLRASNNGDTGANKIYVKLQTALKTNEVVTLRARVKWLHGWPEILLRLKGNYLEAYGRLKTPAAAGTPGAANSAKVANAGPAIYEVTHFPVTPEANQSVVVTARVDDPDGIKEVTLTYRVDPNTATSSVTMKDDGADGDEAPGDGVYSGMIPGFAAGTVIAFSVGTQDGAATPSFSVFPAEWPKRECLVRFGESVQSGAFGTYRLWLTQSNVKIWENRPNLSNEPVESTFVYGNCRAIYNAGGRFSGSPYHQNFKSLTSDAHYTFELPKNERVLGASAFNKIHAPGNGAFDDTTLQREQTAYWLGRQMGIPWLYRRYIHVYLNGTKRKTLMEDTQVGTSDFVKEYWPDDDKGSLFKMQPWFEFTDGTSQSLSFQQNAWCYVQPFTDKSGQHNTRRYRWNWLVRGADSTANDYSRVFELVNAASATTAPGFVATMESLIDVDEWFSFFAVNHALGNWDSVGYRNCQNTYSYKPLNGRWELILWDANIVFGNSGSDGPSNLPLFTTSDPVLTKWFAQGSPLRRRFLSAYYRLVNGPMQVSKITPMLDAKYAAFQEHGVSAQSPAPIKTFTESARSYILSQISKDSAPFSVSIESASDPMVLTGTGPLDMTALEVNGVAASVTWLSSTTWKASVATSEKRLVLAALNINGERIANTEKALSFEDLGKLSLRQEGTEFVLSCSVAREGLYQLQAAVSLINPGWQKIAEQTSNNGTVQFRVSMPIMSYSFYRVIIP